MLVGARLLGVRHLVSSVVWADCHWTIFLAGEVRFRVPHVSSIGFLQWDVAIPSLLHKPRHGRFSMVLAFDQLVGYNEDERGLDDLDIGEVGERS